MLERRIALLAERMGIPIPPVAGEARLGLAGTVRMKQAIPLILQMDADARLGLIPDARDRNGLLQHLNRSHVWTWIELKNAANQWRWPTAQEESAALVSCSGGQIPQHGVAIVFATTAIALRCVIPRESGGLLVHTFLQRKPPYGARLLLADFWIGSNSSFDTRGLFTMVASQMRLRLRVASRQVEREEADERDFITVASRYIEALVNHAKESAPRAQYEIIARAPLRLATTDGDVWPRAFTLPRTKLNLPTEQGQTRSYTVIEVSDDGDVLTLEGNADKANLLERGELSMRAEDDSLRRMREALVTLESGSHEAHGRLLAALTRPQSLLDLPVAPPAEGTPQNVRQREAVALAVRTPDIALIHGPPGTGKTTVICEIVEKLVRAGKRILLVAPTHVALDNVLERVGNRAGVTAIRLGSPDNVEEQAQRFVLENRRRDLTQRLAAELMKATEGALPENRVAQVQKNWAQSIRKDADAGGLLLLNANLVCATPIGIAMANEFRDVEVVFDVMILDEASKATITDFLVPAARAAKWILVGDHRQLPPYTDVDELEAVVSERVKRTQLSDASPDWAGELGTRLRQHFDNRLHPNPERLANAWRKLVEQIGAPFRLDSTTLEKLVALGPDPDAWREAQRTLTNGGADGGGNSGTGAPRPDPSMAARLGAELLEIQRLAMPSVFEHLTRLPKSRAVQLNFQHRMAPALAEFSSKLVYSGDYPSAPSTETLGLDIPSLQSPSIWIDTSLAPPSRRFERARNADGTGGDYINDLEVEVAVELVEACAEWGVQSWRGDPRERGRGADAPFEIGVVCFYLKQALRLRDAIFRKMGPGKDPWRRHWPTNAANGAPIDVHVSIVDRFQGREKDLIILCTTRSNRGGVRGHVDNLNRLNVAVTRARHKRIIIGDSTTLAGEKPGRERPPTDLLRCLYQMCEQKKKWGRALGDRF